MNKLQNVFDKRINFVPEIILQTRARRLKIAGAVFLICFLSVLFIGPVVYLKHSNEESVQKIISLQEMYNKSKVQADEVRRLEREEGEILTKRNLLDQVAKNSRIWAPVLQVVADSVPGEMWFTSLELVPMGKASSGKENTLNDNSNVSGAATDAAVADASLAKDVIPEGSTSCITIKGGAKAVDTVGKFMYKLNTLYDFGRVELTSITRAAETNTIVFELQIILEEEVGRGA